jgi:hypothetical protein
MHLHRYRQCRSLLDILQNIEELNEGDGYGSWIRANADREIVNCSVELDEVLG